ncbi:uncharacterized protein Nmag_1844 [Natrialba magadii ATCC 43099]|uniref:Uncharacterized protein n=1 Tax=Natrialba magadii (strain ATCC 43099 / DSM 3394 / CCM 3739 / CIP 104546 / IAM 13178 / JCM 8861 / NBRC 102185 / NCIMB 2190 / MS3) TaxID=547559 RepID=D3SV09_NATMM|nr:hypothetical protein [Natrialba magadii]ADD05417.1 uncharacterized protein Nmag_1844 [Natrialba magadii ATCC 43099]ELY29269.1 hypothetical protein C500_11145 [Natrialba magadii ATCC 43099]
MKRTILTATLLLVGISLLLNPLYLSPGNLDGEATEITYEVDVVETRTEASQALSLSESILSCGAQGERPCALERAVLEQGELEFDGTLTDDQTGDHDVHQRQNARYDVVQLDGEYYAPELNQTGETTVLTLREVSMMEALEHAAISSDEASDDVQTAVETGSVQLYDERVPEFEQALPIEHDGELYAVDGVRYDGTPDEDLILTRLGLFFAGVTAICFAWVRRGNTD